MGARPMRSLPNRSPRATPAWEGPCRAQRHRDYYFDDGNIVIRVQDTLYKLHRSLLERHSPVFRELFTVPQPEGSTEGLAEDNPIILSGIEAIDFTRLLWLLYPPVLATCPITTVDEWMSIFEQADRWQVDYLREFALARLRSSYIPPIRKILFWTRYNLPPNELIPTYMEIISRKQPLTLQEAEEAGLPMFVKIGQARELVHEEGACQFCKGGFSVKGDKALGAIVQRVFGLPLPDPSTPA
ncbi:hypothetical protein L227DRAFT_619446 [Lentinus tigrinus ALCF2SS1-6]|uniref:BTB domain-containing protein n=1 Tax=Lentinus tigrinus ALCF2SS1-6 TaxID=1328759 RepID=A0A5C2SU96_9APHY|nr:hypothetical protein L227DRAFT_619446 [Lentinus tigrinus ALCF2SS1-6]